MKIPFYIVAITVWTLVFSYILVHIRRHVFKKAKISKGTQKAIYTLLGLSFALHILTRILYSGSEHAVSSGFFTALYWISEITMGLFFILFFWFLVLDIGRFFNKTLLRFKEEPSFDPKKRELLGQSASLGVIGFSHLSTAIGVAQAVQGPEISEIEVPLSNLPPEFDGFKIAQISDLHVGPTIRKEFTEEVVSKTNALSADIVAVTGDMIDGFVPQLQEHVFPLSKLQSKDGVYFITGNHEYYWGVYDWLEHFQSLGMKTLLNENVSIQRGNSQITLAGVTDYKAGRMVPEHETSVKKSLAHSPEHQTKILLAHQPRSCLEASECGVDLQLSGHTHGGQFFPWNLLVYLAHPVAKGLKKVGRTWVYVNSGTGYWGPPVRFGIRSEITLVKLRSMA